MCAMLGILGMGLQIVGAIAGGMAKKRDAELKAEVARMNAEVAERTADTNTALAELPKIAASLDSQKIKDALRVALGAETATYGTANVDPASGAPLLVAGVTAAQAKVDLGLVEVQGELGQAARLADAASGYAGAATERFNVVAAENEARNAMMSAFFGAASALVGGLSSLGGGGGGGFSSGGGAIAFAGATPTGSVGYSNAPSIYSTPAYSTVTPITSSAYRPGAAPYYNWPH